MTAKCDDTLALICKHTEPSGAGTTEQIITDVYTNKQEKKKTTSITCMRRQRRGLRGAE